MIDVLAFIIAQHVSTATTETKHPFKLDVTLNVLRYNPSDSCLFFGVSGFLFKVLTNLNLS